MRSPTIWNVRPAKPRISLRIGQSDQSLCQFFQYSMSVKLLIEHYLEFLSSKGGCTGSSESTLVKRPHCWKSHVVAQVVNIFICFGAQKDNLIEVVLLSAHICFGVLTLSQFFCVATA